MEFLTIYPTVPGNSLLFRDFTVKNKANFKPHFKPHYNKRPINRKRYQHRTFNKDMSHQQRR